MNNMLKRSIAAAAGGLALLAFLGAADGQRRESSGLFPVTINGEVGFIDRTGRLVIKPQFWGGAEFSEGLSVAASSNDPQNRKLGYINSSGEMVIAPRFVGACRFSEGLAAVLIIDDEKSWSRWGFIDKTGRVRIQPRFEFSVATEHVFSEGLAAVEIVGGKWGYVNRAGRLVIRPQFALAGDFSEGLAWVSLSDDNAMYGKYGYIDKTGRFVIRPVYDGAENFSGGLAAVSIGERGEQKLGYVDRTGRMVIKPQFDDTWPCAGKSEYAFYPAGNFSEGLAAVNLDGRWGYIDRTGEIIIKPQFECALRFAEGLAAVGVRRQGQIKFGYIDKSGKMLIDPQFDYAQDFSGGLAAAGVGAPNEEAMERFLQAAQSGRPIEPDLEKAFEEMERKVGYIDRTGRYIWRPTR